MKYWIFKCNPDYYRLTERLSDPRNEVTWLVTRYKKEIGEGDIVFLMETGPFRCIRAAMRVDCSPIEMTELEPENSYWVEPDGEPRCRVRGTLTHRRDVSIDDLKADKALEELSILNGYNQGTNFPVTNEEGKIILRMLEL